MKNANMSYGNKMSEAYAMFSKVNLLFSEHFVPTHILRSAGPNFTFCLPNYKCVAHFTKQFLLEITPKGKNNYNQQNTNPFQSSPPPHSPVRTQSVEAWHAAHRSASTCSEYSEQTLP